MDAGSGGSAPSSPAQAPKRRRVQLRGRSWIITLNDRVEREPSARWAEEAQDRREREEGVDRGHAAAEGADEEEEAPGQGAAADAGAAGRRDGEVGDRVGHFCHPTEVCERLRGAAHLSYFVGQLERGPENGELAAFGFLGCIAQSE